MLTLADIRDWLKLNADADYFYIGKLDDKKEKSIGVYQLKRNNLPEIALGGLENTKTMEKSISILIHWNTNAKETELKAVELYYKLFSLRNFNINGIKINYIKLLVPEPVDVGTDNSNVYERVIEATFYYERKET